MRASSIHTRRRSHNHPNAHQVRNERAIDALAVELDDLEEEMSESISAAIRGRAAAAKGAAGADAKAAAAAAAKRKRQPTSDDEYDEASSDDDDFYDRLVSLKLWGVMIWGCC
jgi:hypothetical protein